MDTILNKGGGQLAASDPLSARTDDTVDACPKCGSTDIGEESHVYGTTVHASVYNEFTCFSCGYN